tara:strand:+ start:66 stop:536 length:471 start_codon:yes stop_codon:yes gene_type:complete
MPSIKKKPTVYEEQHEEQEISFVDYLKTLTLEDFLDYPKTQTFLEDQHALDFDYLPREAIVRCYKRMKKNAEAYFPGVLELDYNTEEGESLAHLIFDNINLKADISVFYECPELARGIDKMDEITYRNDAQKHEAQDKNIKIKNEKKFDWATKTYK